MKQKLKAFNKLHYAEISIKVFEKRRELEAIQLLNLSNTTEASQIEKERNISNELHELMMIEESFFK